MLIPLTKVQQCRGASPQWRIGEALQGRPSGVALSNTDYGTVNQWYLGERKLQIQNRIVGSITVFNDFWQKKCLNVPNGSCLSFTPRNITQFSGKSTAGPTRDWCAQSLIQQKAQMGKAIKEAMLAGMSPRKKGLWHPVRAGWALTRLLLAPQHHRMPSSTQQRRKS